MSAMKQITIEQLNIPKHIAIIMDGNGRWAKKRGMTRNFGHQRGARTLRYIIDACLEFGVSTLSVYAFSTENWQRPKKEVDFLMELALEFFENHRVEAQKKDIKIQIIGERSNLGQDLVAKIEQLEEETKNNQKMTFVVALNYGSQLELTTMVRRIATDVQNNNLNIDDINQKVVESYLYTKDLPPVDLLIRTSGEERISNFMLWQIAYAELYFTKKLWPDFGKTELLKAIGEYQTRNRRFGGVEE